jgi:erythromycin esterase-like protein
MVNVGQLVRERHGAEGVVLVGFASHRGSVLAAEGWGQPEHAFYVPAARAGSHEDLLHASLGIDAVLVFGADRSGPWLTARRGHRAIGVVYDPRRESGNYVPTVMGGRYDALIWFEQADALHPLQHELPPREPELETEPSGF